MTLMIGGPVHGRVYSFPTPLPEYLAWPTFPPPTIAVDSHGGPAETVFDEMYYHRRRFRPDVVARRHLLREPVDVGPPRVEYLYCFAAWCADDVDQVGVGLAALHALEALESEP